MPKGLPKDENSIETKAEAVTQNEGAQEAAGTVMPSQEEIDRIIRKRAHAALAIGLVPVPFIDLAALSAVQTEMLYRLSAAYNLPFSKEWAKKTVALVTATVLPGLLTPSLRNFARYIPVVGFGLGVVSMSLASAASTYALGHAFARHFASGGTFLTCDLGKIKEEVKSTYASSVDKVKSWSKKEPATAEAAS